jgi:hypothetical protein
MPGCGIEDKASDTLVVGFGRLENEEMERIT